MNHAIVYHGKFEINRARLRPSTSTLLRSTDRAVRPLPRTRADGLRFGYMEFVPGDDVVVKVGPVILDMPVRLDIRRHAKGKVGAPSPRIIDDSAARRLLDDILRQNAHLRSELTTAYALIGSSAPSLRSLKSDNETIEVPDVDDTSAMEGGRKWRTHFAIERDRSLVKRKKADVNRRTGRLSCEACGFDFAERYPTLGGDFCEVHHRQGLAARGAATTTRLDDLAVLCSNCHRMIHRTKPMLAVDHFARLLHAEV